MWVESYKANGRRYYRAKTDDGQTVHLGSAESILLKVRPEFAAVLRSEQKKTDNPRTQPVADTPTEPTNE